MRSPLTLPMALMLTFGTALPAAAQYQTQAVTDRATGETYHIEFAANFWAPGHTILISSEALELIGSDIDFVKDLGIKTDRFPDFRLILRPADKHRFRFTYTPIKYQAASVLNRTLVFNGQRFNIGLPVSSTFTWHAFRVGYEYDFIYRDRWFVGVVFDVKYTDVEATLDSLIGTEFARARGPVPAIGGIGRVYVAPNISITGELTGFEIPGRDDSEYAGSYYELDIFGTINFTDHFGVEVGYRSLDVSYKIEKDHGDLRLGGIYFGGVVRY